MMPSPEKTCSRIQAETHDFYAHHHHALGNRGYRVMYGPPITRPPILFIGYQPGGDQRTEDHLVAQRVGWPEACYYATEAWRLAKAMQGMFGIRLLSRCTGLNAIFFRSPNVKTYNREVPRALRQAVEEFCRPRVAEIVAAMQPALVVAIGFESLRFFGSTKPLLANSRERALLIEGSVGGVPAIGALHLSGAQIAREDRAAITSYLLERSAR